MRRAALSILILAGCDPLPPPTTPCDAAEDAFLECGVSVPFLGSKACAGVRWSLATCVLDYAGSCDDLAELGRRPDLCLKTLIGPPPVDTGTTTPIFPEETDR